MVLITLFFAPGIRRMSVPVRLTVLGVIACPWPITVALKIATES